MINKPAGVPSISSNDNVLENVPRQLLEAVGLTGEDGRELSPTTRLDIPTQGTNHVTHPVY